MDGAVENTTTITKLNENFSDDIHVMHDARCLSHFLNLVRNRMTELYPKLKKVMKYLNYMQQSPKCKKHFHKLFKEQPLCLNNVQWYNE